MSKKLIVILVLAFVVGITAAAFAEVQNVKISGDITAVALSRESLNFQKGNNNEISANNEFATVSRIKIDANLTDNVDVTFRLLNERVWGANGIAGEDAATSNAQVDVDLAYITLKEFMKSSINVPLTLVIGRQDIKIGSGLLIGYAGTNQENTTQLPGGAGDLSARAAFDAIVGVWDFTPEFTVITGFVKVAEGKGDAPDSVLAGKDVDAYVLDASYKLGENAMNTVLEGTYVVARQVKNNVNNYGARITSAPIKNLNVEGEYVYQVVNRLSGATVKNKIADAVRLGANYAMPDVTWKPGFGIDYMRLSKTWNPMEESLTPADLTNLLFANTDMQVIGATVSAKPMDDLMLKVRYANLALAKKDAIVTTLGGAATTAGQAALGYEVDAGLAYDYTKDVQLGLNYGLLTPGKAFADKKSASQVIGSMKVSF